MIILIVLLLIIWGLGSFQFFNQDTITMTYTGSSMTISTKTSDIYIKENPLLTTPLLIEHNGRKQKEHRGDEISIRPRIQGRDYEVEVQLPKGCIAIDASSISGSIEIDESTTMYEDVRCKTISGEIEGYGIRSGRFSAESTSGDVDFAHIEAHSVSIETASGDININDGLLDEGNIKSISGSVDGLFSVQDRLEISTISGDIDATIERKGITLTASSISGDVNLYGMEGKNEGKVVKGKSEITLKSTSGDITISE